jgi:hypothetical protein
MYRPEYCYHSHVNSESEAHINLNCMHPCSESFGACVYHLAFPGSWAYTDTRSSVRVRIKASIPWSDLRCLLENLRVNGHWYLALVTFEFRELPHPKAPIGIEAYRVLEAAQVPPRWMIPGF